MYIVTVDVDSPMYTGYFFWNQVLMDLQHKIEEFAAPFLHPIDAFIVDIQIVPGEQQKVVKLYVDTDTGITIGQCSELSRQVSAVLELQNVFESSHILEVSSPGLEKPLKLLRQYQKNVGRQFRVRFKKDDGTGEILAKLSGVENELLTFVTGKNEIFTISFNEIIESIEELPW
jgi:ribosome maturation factor RimP